MHKYLPLLLVFLLAACSEDTPPARPVDPQSPTVASAAERARYPYPEHPGYPLALPDSLSRPGTRRYIVGYYLEPDTLAARWLSAERGTVELFFDSAPRYERGRRLFEPRHDTPADSAEAYLRQARLRGEDGTPRLMPAGKLALLMNLTALRAELLRADGTARDVSPLAEISYDTAEPLIKSGYTAALFVQYTRPLTEMTAERLMWVDPYLPVRVRLPRPAKGETYRFTALRADGHPLIAVLDAP